MLVERLRAIVANVIRAWQQAADSPAPAVHRAPAVPAPRRCLRFDVDATDKRPWHDVNTRADFFPLASAAMITRRAQRSLWPAPGLERRPGARKRGATGSRVRAGIPEEAPCWNWPLVTARPSRLPAEKPQRAARAQQQ